MPDDPALVPGIGVDTLVEAGDWPDHAAIASIAGTAIAAAAARARPVLAPGAEVTVILTDDQHIRALNHRFRGKDAPTNVLSFAAGPPIAGRHGPLLGDIVLARETVAGEAADRDIDLCHHATHLIVHGFLHLVGYDHETENEAVVMEGLETFIMQDLGIADPYAS